MTVEMTDGPTEVEVDAPAVDPAQTQEVTTPESEAQTDTPEEAPKPKPANPVQVRINELTWKAHEAERRANAAIMAQQEAQRRAYELEQQQQEYVRRATVPKFEQYNDLERYQQAVEQHSQQYIAQQQQALRQAQENQSRAYAQAQEDARLSAYVAEGKQKFADFEEVINNPSLPNLRQVNPVVVQAIIEDPAIAYYLGKNTAEAHRIAGLPPVKALTEVGKIAAKLSQPARKTSSAPNPVPTVGGKSVGVQKDPDKMSYAEFAAWRGKSRT